MREDGGFLLELYMTSLSLFQDASGTPESFAVAGVAVRQDAHGRFCLNDLHKAAILGGANERTTEPGKFLASPNIAELCDEIVKTDTRNLGIAPVESIRGGLAQGTYVCKELVYAYAMWVSASFHLQVIRAYDGMVQAKTGVLATATAFAMPATPLGQDLEALQILASWLNVAPSGQIGMARVAVAHHAPHLLPALPGYAIDAPVKPGVAISGSSEPTFSATHLIKQHGVKISVVAFNKLLRECGVLSHENRRASNGRLKAFWSVTDKWLAFGKNVVSDKNQRETSPHWYESTFARLLAVAGVVA